MRLAGIGRVWSGNSDHKSDHTWRLLEPTPEVVRLPELNELVDDAKLLDPVHVDVVPVDLIGRRFLAVDI
jgi:hypothetical protein